MAKCRTMSLIKAERAKRARLGSPDSRITVTPCLWTQQWLGQSAWNFQGFMREGGRLSSGKKKFHSVTLKKFLKKKITIFFACNLTLPHLFTRDDSLGFEDCRLATHLLNLVRWQHRRDVFLFKNLQKVLQSIGGKEGSFCTFLILPLCMHYIVRRYFRAVNTNKHNNPTLPIVDWFRLDCCCCCYYKVWIRSNGSLSQQSFAPLIISFCYFIVRIIIICTSP